jgi:hypothetical protein
LTRISSTTSTPPLSTHRPIIADAKSDIKGRTESNLRIGIAQRRLFAEFDTLRRDIARGRSGFADVNARVSGSSPPPPPEK